jgi:hypothetical protein
MMSAGERARGHARASAHVSGFGWRLPVRRKGSGSALSSTASQSEVLGGFAHNISKDVSLEIKGLKGVSISHYRVVDRIYTQRSNQQIVRPRPAQLEFAPGMALRSINAADAAVD